MKHLCLILVLLYFMQPLYAFGEAEFCPRTTCPLVQDCDRESMIFISGALMFSIAFYVAFRGFVFGLDLHKISDKPDEMQPKDRLFFGILKKCCLLGVLGSIGASVNEALSGSDCCAFAGLMQASAHQLGLL